MNARQRAKQRAAFDADTEQAIAEFRLQRAAEWQEVERVEKQLRKEIKVMQALTERRQPQSLRQRLGRWLFAEKRISSDEMTLEGLNAKARRMLA